ncbi:MAG: hypothetical protein P4L69_01255 [Desulfosporosinus sp.]|nr:hypothetical protein [Desulfosporosinus sp.]
MSVVEGGSDTENRVSGVRTSSAIEQSCTGKRAAAASTRSVRTRSPIQRQNKHQLQISLFMNLPMGGLRIIREFAQTNLDFQRFAQTKLDPIKIKYN